MTEYRYFKTILLDMNETFMFGGDRFSLSDNYFETYQEIGGTALDAPQVSRVINGVFCTMNSIYVDSQQQDNFPSVEHVLNELPESKLFSKSEKETLENVFAIHELGDISDDCINAIAKLANNHSLYLVSNIWSRKNRFCQLLMSKGLTGYFRSLVFSSDTSSIKPSPNLFRSLNGLFEPECALFVGDCQRCDIGFANSIGMKSVWLSHGRELVDDLPKPDFVTNDLLSFVEDKITPIDKNDPFGNSE